MKKTRQAVVPLEYSNYLLNPPATPKDMIHHAAANDQATFERWEGTWISQIKANKAKFGSFKDHSVGKFFKEYEQRPCIVAGSGPSLKNSLEALRNRKGMPLVSCLHNFQYFEDNDIHPEFYVTLDAGPVTIEEVYEGGRLEPEEYWARTKNHKLVAYIGTHPELLARWQGEIYFYSALTNEHVQKEVDDVEKFWLLFSTGGCVLGSSLYMAKGILGCVNIAFVGADFAFSYDKKFHAWDSKYDRKLGNTLRVVDVFGNKVHTWVSYFGFKSYFDSVSLRVPGLYFNCSEGGTFGAYPDGNLISIKQCALEDFVKMHTFHDSIEINVTAPDEAEQPVVLYL